jgi:glycosyltransferase involved in cell wall biosynthesis
VLSGAHVAVVNWRDPAHRQAGGAEIYAWEFAQGLLARGAEVEFITSRDVGQSRRELVEGVSVVRRGGFVTYFVWAFLHLLRHRRRYDLVMDASTGIPVFAPLAVRRRTPVVLVMHHVHLDQFGTHFSRPMAALGRFLEGWLMPRVYADSRTVAVSESTREEMRARLGWRGPIDLLMNGAFVPTDPGPPERDPHRLVVLGRLVAHKRVDLIIRAVDRLPETTLDVVGRGPDQEHLARVVGARRLGERVTLHGFVDEDTKAGLLRGAGVHLCASDAEGWGQVVIEAASYGLPTIARRVPGLRDAIDDGRTGWLVDDTPGDDDAIVDALVGAIERAVTELSDPARQAQIFKQCREWSARFNWTAMRTQAADLAEAEMRHITIR